MFGVAPSPRWRGEYVAGAVALLVAACSIAERRVEERRTPSAHGGSSSAGAVPSAAGHGGVAQVPSQGGAGGSSGDELLPARDCAPWEPFGLPHRVLGLTEAGFSDGKVWLSPDEGSVYFLSTRVAKGEPFAGPRLWMATRPSPDNLFDRPLLFDTPAFADDMALTADGEVLFVALGGSIRALRRETALRFSLLDPPALQLGTSVWASDLGTRVYFSQQTDRGTQLATWYRKVGDVRTPTPLASIGVNLPLDCALTLSHDEKELFVAAPGNSGDRDIFVATRDAVTQPFGTAHPLAELNTVEDEAPSWLSLDACRLYFERTGPEGGIFVASRPRPCEAGAECPGKSLTCGACPAAPCADKVACVDGYWGTETLLDAEVRDVVIDERYVYGALEFSKGILRTGLAPGSSAETTLAADTGYVWRLTATGGEVIFSTHSGRGEQQSLVAVVAREGGATRVLATPSFDGPPVAADGTFAYWLEPSRPCALMRVRREGGPAEVLASFEQACDAELILSGREAFVASDRALNAVSLDNGQLRKIGELAHAVGVTVQPQFVLVSDGENIWEGGGAYITSPTHGVAGLFSDSAHAFWGEGDAVRFYSFDQQRTGTLGAGPPPVEVVGVDASFVYYSDGGGSVGKRVRRTLKP